MVTEAEAEAEEQQQGREQRQAAAGAAAMRARALAGSRDGSTAATGTAVPFTAGCTMGVLNGKKKVFQNQFSQKIPRALHVLNHGWWRLAVGSWQLAVGGGWWWLAAVGGW